MNKDKIGNLLNIISTYSIVQVLAQDLGIKTGRKQRDLIQNFYVQMVILYSCAYMITNSFRDSLIVTFAYYFLKYIYSENETSSVCFESI